MKNLYSLFKEIFPDAPLDIAEVVAVSGELATVQMPGGGRAVVRGTGTVGQMVYVRDGVIESGAPDLPVFEIEV